MSLTPSQRETSIFFPSWVYSLSEAQKKKIAIALLQEVLCLILILCCLYFFLPKIDRLLVVFTSCLLTVYVCSGSGTCWVEKNRSWNSLSLKSDVKSPSIRESIHVVQITEKGESEKAKKKNDRKKENCKKVLKQEKAMVNPFEVLGKVSRICLQIASESISKARV